MLTSIIMAVSENDVIGIGNKLPWNIPYDLKWFRMNTYGGVVIMGRRTRDSLPCNTLKGRLNIVLSRSDHIDDKNILCKNFKEALAVTKGQRKYIIGGADIYNQALLLKAVDQLIITRVHTKINHKSAVYMIEPKFKEKIWSSKTFHHKNLSFHFEIYKLK